MVISQSKKCPNCGALIPSLALICPECNYTFIQETESSIVARESIERLQALLKEFDQSDNAISAEQLAQKKATAINTFVVPNTKEAMISFLALAFSNIESTNNTQDRVITMAWEGKAMSTYNLLKLQKGSDDQIESALQQYSILEDKKALAKLDGTARIKGKRVKRNVLISIIVCVPIVSALFYLIKHDSVLESIRAGEYDDAITKLTKGNNIKHDVDFYIDRLAASPAAIGTTLVEVDSTKGTRTKTIFYKDGAKEIYRSDLDVIKNQEVLCYNSNGDLRFHRVDTLHLAELLWSVSEEALKGLDVLDLYTADTLGLHFDNRGRCDALVFAFSIDTTKCSFKYNNLNMVIVQDVTTSTNTIHISTRSSYDVGNSVYTISDSINKGGVSRSETRIYSKTHQLLYSTSELILMGQPYLMSKYSIEVFDSVFMATHESISNDRLSKYDFEDGPTVDEQEIRSNQSGKGVLLHYN